MRQKLTYTIIALTLFSFSYGQKKNDTTYNKVLDEVVVTGTRTENKVSNLPLPIQVISAKTIRESGSQKLLDILQMQSGLMVASNPLGTALQGYPNPFGDGIQMQGLDPSYTLILIDGEPMTGRNAGIINLGRIAVGNIKQIEILRGPATSLYGSDALAGVINIITLDPVKNNAELQTHYASNNTLGLSGSANLKFNKSAIQVFAKRYSSDGYDFDKNIYGKTVDPFVDYAANLKFIYTLNNNSDLLISTRFSTNKQINNYLIYPNNTTQEVGGNTIETDKSAYIRYKHILNSKINYTGSVYTTTYDNNARIYEKKSNNLFDHIGLNQFLLRPEMQVNIGENPASLLVTGVGYNFESINSTRYSQPERMNSWYIFGQKQFQLHSKTNVIVGARYDKNELYSAQLSPKLAIAHKITPDLILKASIGTGFKAPDFRQQFLNFDNGMVGYTIIGARELSNVLQKLKTNGQFASSVDITPYLNNKELVPEKSVGINIGFDYTHKQNTVFKANFFRNDITNLIESFTIPFRTIDNGGFFSYMNVNKVFTTGVETNFSHRFNKNFNISGGYQFLVAKDKEVLQKIKNKEMYRRDPVTNETSLVTKDQYSGLFNRSKHSANMSLRYSNNQYNASAFLTAKYRGRFGYNGDNFQNGNAILDDDREFINGFTLVNATISKKIATKLEIQGGIENILNYTNRLQMPGQYGRSFFINCNLKLEK
jgi:outer membrane receptor for ferrienterochelin and colicins